MERGGVSCCIFRYVGIKMLGLKGVLDLWDFLGFGVWVLDFGVRDKCFKCCFYF